MSDRIVAFTAPGHAAAVQLLPWLVNGTLEGEERNVVEHHVGECRVCQREVDVLRKMQSLCVASEGLTDVDRALAKLGPQLSGPSRIDTFGNVFGTTLQRFRGAAPWAAAIALALLIGGGVLLRTGDTPPMYRTLGSDKHVAHDNGRIVVKFGAQPAAADLAAIVAATRAGAISGPNGVGAFVIDVAPPLQEAAIAYLRKRPDVVLAERLGPPAGHP